MAAAGKNTSPVCHSLYQRNARCNKITAAAPIDLHDLSDQPDRHRDPYERPYNVISAPALEAVFDPALEEHPYDGYRIDQKYE